MLALEPEGPEERERREKERGILSHCLYVTTASAAAIAAVSAAPFAATFDATPSPKPRSLRTPAHSQRCFTVTFSPDAIPIVTYTKDGYIGIN